MHNPSKPTSMTAASRAPVCRTLLRVVAAFACALVLDGAAAAELVPSSGAQAPPLALRDLAGRDIRLADFRGRTVIVNFWATWCAPCVKEMPSLQRLRDRLAGDGLTVIAVNYQENAARIQPFLDRMRLDLTVVRDHDGSVRDAWDVNVFPTTFVVNPNQRISLVAVGEIDWDDAQVEARIRELGGRPRTVAERR